MPDEDGGEGGGQKSLAHVNIRGRDVMGLGRAAQAAQKVFDKLPEFVSLFEPTKRTKARADAKAYATKTQATAEAESYVLAKTAELAIVERADKLRARLRTTRQGNLDNIVYEAIGQSIRDEDDDIAPKSDAPLDDEWLLRFLRYAEDVTTEEMQQVWARVLAREARKPGTFSFRALMVLSNVTKEESEIFIRLCKMTTDDGSVLRPPVAMEPRPVLRYRSSMGEEMKELKPIQEYRSLDDYGISFHDLILMVNAGLVSTEQTVLGTWPGTDTDVTVTYGSIAAVMSVLDATFESSHYLLTPAGVDLTSLVDRGINAAYLRALKLGYDAIGFPTKFVNRKADGPDVDITETVMQGA